MHRLLLNPCTRHWKIICSKQNCSRQIRSEKISKNSFLRKMERGEPFGSPFLKEKEEAGPDFSGSVLFLAAVSGAVQSVHHMAGDTGLLCEHAQVDANGEAGVYRI